MVEEELELTAEEPQEPQEEKEEKINLFDLFNDISTHGKFLENYVKDNKSLPSCYSSFMATKYFANFKDTIFIANEMNKYYSIPDEIQWRFLKGMVTKKKRYTKWLRDVSPEESISLLASYFHCTVKEMQKNLSALSQQKIKNILSEIDPEKYKKDKK